MTEKELFDLIQSRMTTSYNEQLWAVALVGSMCGFVIVNAKKIVQSIGLAKLSTGIKLTTAICIIFILTRLAIYIRYDNIVNNELPCLSDYSLLINHPALAAIMKWSILISGSLLYSCILAGMSIAAVLTCKKAAEEITLKNNKIIASKEKQLKNDAQRQL